MEQRAHLYTLAGVCALPRAYLRTGNFPRAPIWRLCRNKGLHPLRRLRGYPCTPTKTVHPPLAPVPFLRVLLSYPGGDEISIEECRDEVDTVYRRLLNPIEESVESKLMWAGIKKYLHKLTPKECEVMISLYVDHLSVRETAAKLKVDDSTVSTHHKNARDKIRNAMEE